MVFVLFYFILIQWFVFGGRVVYSFNRFAFPSCRDKSVVDFFLLFDFDLLPILLLALSCNCVKNAFDDFSAFSSFEVFFVWKERKKTKKWNIDTFEWQLE